MKIKNLVIYGEDQRKLEELRSEYRDYGGYDCQLYRGKLIVFALPRSARKGKKANN